MTDKHVQHEAPHTNMEKDPSDWVTGDEPMTGAQMSYLKTLSEQAKVPFDEALTKAEASERIEELQQQTGRGAQGHASPSSSHASRTRDASETDGRSDAGEEDPGAADEEPDVAGAVRDESRR